MSALPLVVNASGLVPAQPADVRATLVAGVAATNPDYTANLPGSLIEDIASTDVLAILTCNSALVETVNSLTPFGANAFLLLRLGEVYGVPLGEPTNTSVSVVFTGPPGFLIAKGFTVSDGTYQYTVSDGGIIGSNGVSLPLFAVAVLPGSWAVPSSTVNLLITSVPSTIDLTVINPNPGLPGIAAETMTAYRPRVLQAGLAASQGMARYLKTLLSNVPGVQARLISVRQQGGGGWEVICAGGDPYFMAYAVYSALFDISTLTGSVLEVSGATKANPGVITTNLNHGFATGQVITIAGALGMTELNGTPLTITVIDETNFSIGVDTSSFPTYTGGGVVSPNFRNVTVSINDYPDTYSVPLVNPPQQSVAIAVTWNTISLNSVPAASVAALAIPALVDYVNSIAAGQPINLFVLQSTFQAAVANILAPSLLTRMVFAVSINGIGVSPESGTGIIAGDPESYMLTDSSLVTVLEG